MVDHVHDPWLIQTLVGHVHDNFFKHSKDNQSTTELRTSGEYGTPLSLPPGRFTR